MGRTQRWSRRRALALGAAGLCGLVVPGRARSATVVGPSERRFLFLVAAGGWDPTRVFAPLFGHPHAAMEDGASEARSGGLSYVDHPERPSVRGFFDDWAPETAVLSGFEVRSITHERCTRLLMTGRGDAGGDDWPALLGAGARPELTLPTLVCSGPSFTDRLTSGVVRIGSDGQLSALLDGTALHHSTVPVWSQGRSAEEAVADALAVRARRLAAEGSDFAAALDRSLVDWRSVQADSELLRPELPMFENCGGVWRELATAMGALASGRCRAAVVGYRGWCSQTFDQHSDIGQQSLHFEELFQHLRWTVDTLALADGPAGGSLLDETTVVVLSEMGRHPQLNAQGGKDHWTFTSAMLIGSGVAGGQTVGGFDDDMMGQPIDLQTGVATAGGVALQTGNLGATLLALGDVDPVAQGIDAAPIGALLA